MTINFSNIKLSNSQIFYCKTYCRLKGTIDPRVAKIIKRDVFEKNILTPDFKRIKQPITSKKEYLSLLKKLKESLNNNLNYIYFAKLNKKYKNADAFEEGVIPYCGVDDCSDLINRYLSGRLASYYTYCFFSLLPRDVETLPELIRLIEYSLKRIDEKFGKYQGIVYRIGFMSKNPSQYTSSTIDSEYLTNRWRFEPNEEFSIIKVQNGHKICNFQKEHDMFNYEQEILLPFENKYKKLSEDELTADLRIARKNLASRLFSAAKKIFSERELEVKGYTKEKFLNRINVYVQQI